MIPACTQESLRALSKINDALRRTSVIEAIRHTEDALILIQNELDWCFHTDPILPFMFGYFRELNLALSQMPNSTIEARREQVACIVRVNEQTIQRVGNLETGEAKERAPDASVDCIEQGYLARLHSD
jgi:hypothetical protein